MSGSRKEVVVFLLDGCRADAIDRADAPTLQELSRKGIRAQECSTVYPSLTGPGHISILTGAYPERTGITGHFYWSKEEGKLYDIFSDEYCQVETIFEVLLRNGLSGVNLGAHMRRGASDTKSRQVVRKMASVLGPAVDWVDRWPSLYMFLRGFVVGRYSEFKKAFEAGEHSFYYVVFTEVDKAGHRYGPESQRYYDVIAECDGKIGDCLDLADSLRRDMTVVVTADHGQTTIREKLGIDSLALDEMGYAVDDSYDLAGSRIVLYNKERENMAVAAVVSRHAQIWPRKEEDRQRVAAAFQGRRGITNVRTRDEVRSLGLFHSRVGDVSFCLEPGFGFDFLRMAERGDHGGVDPADMRVPLIIYHPSLEARGVREAKVVDVAPTVLEALGLGKPESVQGHSIFSSR